MRVFLPVVKLRHLLSGARPDVNEGGGQERERQPERDRALGGGGEGIALCGVMCSYTVKPSCHQDCSRLRQCCLLDGIVTLPVAMLGRRPELQEQGRLPAATRRLHEQAPRRRAHPRARRC